MRKFLLLCLTALCSLVTQGLWAQDTFELSLTADDLSTYKTAMAIALGTTVDAIDETKTLTFTSVNNTEATVEAVLNYNKNALCLTFSEALEEDTYTLTIPDGYLTISDDEGNTSTSIGNSITFEVKAENLGELIFKTNFTETSIWGSDGFAYSTTDQTIEVTTEDSQNLTFTFSGFGVYPDKAIERSPNYTGYMESIKNNANGWTTGTDISVTTSELNSVGKIKFTQATTGSSRGLTIAVKGTKADGTTDEDWVYLFNQSIVNSVGETNTIKVNRTNCQIKFGSFAEDQNVFVPELAIYDIANNPDTFEFTSVEATAIDENTVTLTISPAVELATDCTDAITISDEDTYSATPTVESDDAGTTWTLTLTDALTAGTEYTVTIPGGYFQIDDEINEGKSVTFTYTVETDPVSIELLDEVEDGVYAITKTGEELMALEGFTGSASSCYATYDTGTILYDDDNIKIEVATDQTYIANSGYQLSDIQAEYSDYTAFINMGVASGQLDTIDENSDDPTQYGAAWQGMLKVTPTVDGALTFNVHTGTNSRTLAIYEVGTRTWINITHDVVGFGSASADLTAGNEYVLVCNGNNNNLYQITFAPVEPLVIELYTEVEDDTYAITASYEDLLAMGYIEQSDGNCNVDFDAGTILYEGENIKIEVAADGTHSSNYEDKASSMKADFSTYTAYVRCGSTLGRDISYDDRITDPASVGRNRGMLMVTPTVDGELEFGVYAGNNQRSIGIYEVATDEEIAAGTERAWVNINVFKHTGDAEDSTAPDLPENAPAYVSGSVTAGRQYLLVGGGNNNMTLHQITFTPEDEIVTEPEPEQEEIVIYETGFTEWPEYDAPIVTEDGELPSTDDGTTVTVTTTTGEDVIFTLAGVSIIPGDDTYTNSSGTTLWTDAGALKFQKYPSEYTFKEPYVESTVISSVTKLTFTEAVTGNERGAKVLVKGDGDDDWVEVFNTLINSGSKEQEVEINRDNCQIRFENLSLENYVYILDLTIYGYEETKTEPESEPVSGAITWVLDEGTANQPATYSLGTEDAYTSNSITLGSNLVYTGSTRTVTDGNENNETYDETVTFTTFNNLADEAEAEAAQSNAIDFAVEMAEGYTFAPTEVSLYATRIGTDACNLNVTWVDSEGNETQMIATSASTGDNPGRANGTPNTFTKYTLDLSEYNIETIEDGTFKLRINVFNMAGGKTFGLANIVIKGQVSGVDIDDIYETLCDEIDATDEYLETTWATIKADYPDAITEELESEYKEISEEIETLQAAVDDSYEEGTLGEEVLDYETQIASIKAEIDALLETALGINSITIESAGVKGIYTISGQKVAAPTKAGIYIIDGKKVVIK